MRGKRFEQSGITEVKGKKMMISTKGRYALRVMADLAEHGPEYVSLSDVSARQAVSLKYLEAIIAALSRADFVESRRGKTGGYRLKSRERIHGRGDVEGSGGEFYAGFLFGLIDPFLLFPRSLLSHFSPLERAGKACGRISRKRYARRPP